MSLGTNKPSHRNINTYIPNAGGHDLVGDGMVAVAVILLTFLLRIGTPPRSRDMSQNGSTVVDTDLYNHELTETQSSTHRHTEPTRIADI